MNGFLTLLLLMVLAINSFGSVETALCFSQFEVRSPGTERTGPVFVEGQGDEKGNLIKIEVTAFGKTFSLPLEQLTKYEKQFVNGVTLSSGVDHKGIPEVYVVMSVGSALEVMKRWIFTVHEDGKIEFLHPKNE